ncbi:MAG: M64 family metallopeptidase [Bdellovibrionales bacterium]
MKVLILCLLSVFCVSVIAQEAVVKAKIVDQEGRILGYRGVRDLSLCGKSMGYSQIAEQSIGPVSRMFLDCSAVNPWDLQTLEWYGSEVRTLISQGPVENRIDLTIVSDGYTEPEKQKFFEDSQKIAEDLFTRETFATYRALFNVHAVFVPSVESGIGDGRPKNTAIKLYRHPSVRQAVMTGDSFAASRASRLAPDVDYPILLGNDPFYGGLGGQFAITTSAPLNLTTVLRHELGHNFGRVGEEYDGGQVYDGANFSSSVNVSWKHWLKTNPTPSFRSPLLHYSAPWKSLTNADLVQSFTLTQDSKVMFDFSSLGFDTKNDVMMFVDNIVVEFDGNFNYDRNFYIVYKELKAGTHTVKFTRKAMDTNNILSKLAIYALPTDYPVGTMDVAAFATYNESGSMVGYRPTDRVCLMKDMHSHRFCPVCIENMWSFFLKEVSLVDSITISPEKMVMANLVPVGATRLKLEWFDGRGQLRTDLTNQTKWSARSTDQGTWKLRASFITPEVIKPGHQDWTIHEATFVLN